jgi:hypothetical protein
MSERKNLKRALSSWGYLIAAILRSSARPWNSLSGIWTLFLSNTELKNFSRHSDELGAGWPHRGAIPDGVERSFRSVRRPDGLFEPIRLTVRYRRPLCLRERRRGRERDRPSPSNSEVKNVCSCHMPSVRPRNNFTLSNAGHTNYHCTNSVRRHRYSGMRVSSCVCFKWNTRNTFWASHWSFVSAGFSPEDAPLFSVLFVYDLLGNHTF